MDKERISLKVPAKPEYILVMRLTTSAVACRLGFAIDEIEDIKTAVVEAGTLIIKQFKNPDSIEIVYEAEDNDELKLDVHVCGRYELNFSAVDEEMRELGFCIIESLMDKVNVRKKEERVYGITMYKRRGGQVADEKNDCGERIW